MVNQGHLEYATDDYQKSLRLARWSAFTLEVDFCIIWVKPLSLAKPGAPRPYSEADLQTTSEWKPYPRTGPTATFNPAGLYGVKFDLREIGADILPVMLSGDPEDSPMPGHVTLDLVTRIGRLAALSERLRAWKDDLPPYARINTEAVPSWALVELHLIWHDYCIAVYSLMLRDMVDSSIGRHEARTALADSCKEVAKILTWLQRRLGSAAMWCPWTFQAAAMAAYPLADLLREDDDVVEAFHVIVACLSTLAKRWILARGVLKMLWILLEKRSLVDELLPATVEIFQTNAVDDWGPEDYRMFSGCMYPNYSAIAEQGRELADMGELMEQWSQLTVNEGRGRKASWVNSGP